MERWGRRAMVVSSALHMLAYLYAQSEHVADASWPPHARFHVLQALLWIVALDLANLVVALRAPLVWGRWLLLVGGVAAHGAYFVSLAAIPEGTPPEGWGAHLPLAALGLVYAAGLALAFCGASPPRSARRSVVRLEAACSARFRL